MSQPFSESGPSLRAIAAAEFRGAVSLPDVCWRLSRARGCRAARPIRCIVDQLRRSPQAQLAFEVFPVRLDRLEAQLQLLRNFTRAQSRAEQVQHVQFAVGELFEAAPLNLRRAADKLLQHHR